MKHIHFDVESDGFYGAYWACRGGSDCTVIATLGDDPEDYMARSAVKMIAKTWLKSAKIKDVGAYFAVSDAPQEISAWDSRLQVTSRGYMLGYTDLKDPSVSGFFRFLARVGDGMMKMQIVKIRFGGKQ